MSLKVSVEGVEGDVSEDTSTGDAAHGIRVAQ